MFGRRLLRFGSQSAAGAVSPSVLTGFLTHLPEYLSQNVEEVLEGVPRVRG
jgi:hypothetical protein